MQFTENRANVLVLTRFQRVGQSQHSVSEEEGKERDDAREKHCVSARGIEESRGCFLC